MFSCGKSCPGNCLFAQVVIPDFEGGDELKKSSEVKGSLGPTGFRSAQGLGARVAVELSVESARKLVESIQAVLARVDAGGYLESPESAERL
jgi:hypothetical protein